MISQGGCEENARNIVKSAWAKCHDMLAAVCNNRMPVKLKTKTYKTIVRLVMGYGAETWATYNDEERILERTEMRMLNGLRNTFDGEKTQ